MSSIGLLPGWVDIDLAALRGGTTITAAARAAGVNRRSWQRWERLGRMPSENLELFRTYRHQPAEDDHQVGRRES